MMRLFSLAARIKYRMEFSERILTGSNPAEATPRPVASWGLTELNADLNWLNVALSFASRSSNGAARSFMLRLFRNAEIYLRNY
jgi:hypothetical protein